jgi:hypothetical protein
MKYIFIKYLIFTFIFTPFIFKSYIKCQNLPISWGQYIYSFEDTTHYHSLIIDYEQNPDNIWQIGKPDKTIFNSAHSQDNAIVTDTVSSYPPSDTSVFTMYHKAQKGFIQGVVATFEGFYKVDSDTLFDYGKIEFSPDNRSTWIDLLNDTIYSNYYHWITEKPVLTGKKVNWTFFAVQLAGFNQIFPIYDTTIIHYRITFISDAIDTQREGLIFDDFVFKDHLLSVNEKDNHYSIDVYPNPCKNELLISINEDNLLNEIVFIELRDLNNQLLKNKSIQVEKVNNINMSDIKLGIYIIQLQYKNSIIYSSRVIKL